MRAAGVTAGRFARIGAALLLCVLLAGCGKSVDRAGYDAVETGMSEREVIALLGEPDRSRSITVGGLSGSHFAWDGKGFTVAVQFVDGEVVGKQWIAGDD